MFLEKWSKMIVIKQDLLSDIFLHLQFKIQLEYDEKFWFCYSLYYRSLWIDFIVFMIVAL